MKKPKFSIIIPVFNVEAYIADSIKSVLSQTFEDFEILIVDDGSPDRSIDVCKSFSDLRIKIIQQSNRGLSGARNTGIRHSKGDYIAFLDGDDMWRPEKLEKHLKHLEANRYLGVSFSYSEFIDTEGTNLKKYVVCKKGELTLVDLFRRNPVGNGSTPVMRREVFDAVKFHHSRDNETYDCFYDESLRRNEDYELLFRILIKTPWRLEVLPEPLTLYRVNPNGLSANLDKQYESWQELIEKVLDYYPNLTTSQLKQAKSYQLRYLARNSIRLGDGKKAVELIDKSIGNHWRILVEEPYQTIATFTVAHIQQMFPKLISKF